MKRLLFIATVILTFLNLSIKAQSPSISLDWAARAGSSAIDKATAVTTDASGNVYTVGYFGGTVDFNPGAGTNTLTAVGGYDAFLQKLDANGNFVAVYSLGAANSDVINSVTLDASGNIYIGGYFTGSVDFDLGAGVSALNSGTVQSAFVAKYSSAFSLTWCKMLTGASSQYITSVAVDNTGNVYSTGSVGAGIIDFDPNAGVNNFTVTTGTTAFFVHKLTSAGNLTWAKGFNGGNSTVGNSVVIDGNGDPIIGGRFTNTIDFDPGAGVVNYSTFSSSVDAFLLKLNAAGVYQFAFPIGVGSASLNDYDEIHSVKVDNANNIYVAGRFSRTVDFDPSASTQSLTVTSYVNGVNNTDGFVAKYTSAGVYQWATNSNLNNTGSFDQANSIDISSSSDVVVVSVSNSASNPIARLTKFSAAGTFIYGRDFGVGTIASGVEIDFAGDILMTGNFVGTVDMDPAQYYTSNLVSGGQDDIFTAKFSECTTPSSSGPLSGATALCNGSVNTYSIAAVGGALSYNWSNTAAMSGTSTTNTISLTSGATATMGVISVTGYNHCGNSPTQTLQVTTTPNTTVNISASSNSVCTGSSVTLTANGTSTYLWGTSETSSSIVKNPTATTVYTVTGYNGNCSNTKTITINTVALPVISTSVMQSTMACPGQPVNITASGANTYTWNTASNSATINVTPTVSTTYTVVGTSTVSGCVNTKTVTVSVQSLTLAVSASAYTICPGGFSSLSVSGAQSYTWNGPGGSSTGSVYGVSPTTTSTYVVGGTGITGCTTSTNIVIYVTSSISLSTSASSTISCSGDPVSLSANGATSYTWNPGVLTGSMVSVSPTSATVYTVIGVSGGCSNTKTISINVGTKPNVTAITNSPLICEGQSASLNASVTPFVAGMSYTWSTGQTSANISVSPTITTTYTVTGKNNFSGGCTNTAIVTQSVSPAISILATSSASVSCSGSPVSITASGASSYTWSTSSNSNAIAVSPTSTTTYTVNGTSGACSATQTITINASTNPSMSAASSSTMLCTGSTATISSNGSGVVSYLWNTGAVTPDIVVSPTSTTVYTLTGTNASGCSSLVVFTQSVSVCTGINEVDNVKNGISIFPNPNNGEFTIATTKGIYNIINAIGAVVKIVEIENSTEAIDVKDLPQGVYYIIGKAVKSKIIITK